MQFEKICVLGLGYIGLPTASTIANQGVQVIGVDVNPVIVDTLRNGGLHLHEPGLRTLVQAALASGKLTINDKPENADAFIIAVPTPFYGNKQADMRAVKSAAEAIVPYIQTGNLVILESTSPPRTTLDIVAPILAKSGLKPGEDFYLAYSPERVLPGQILRELIDNARVIGGINKESAEAGKALYAIFSRGEIIMTDSTTAEMVKLMENTYRDVNIAVANEFSRLAQRFGIDVWEAIAIANRHPRVKILQPGPGVGGHCISVDPWFLVEAAPDITPLIHTARKVNDSQPQVVVDLIQRVAKELKGCRVTLLGLSYKPDVDDIRESPALEVVSILAEAGTLVTVYEPFKKAVDLAENVILAPSLEDAIRNTDVIVLLVAHTQFLELEASYLADHTRCRLLVDTVNGWRAPEWTSTGFKIYRLGVGKQA
ncbi:MAG: nucleotide sugar dehydrogenase [Anaerolineales bacterium]|nr:nucleotide sugar dehydrogenase [Anaerolineales bacterium]